MNKIPHKIKIRDGINATYANIYQYVLNELNKLFAQYFKLSIISIFSHLYHCFIDLINQSKTGIYKSKYEINKIIHIAILITTEGWFKSAKKSNQLADNSWILLIDQENLTKNKYITIVHIKTTDIKLYIKIGKNNSLKLFLKSSNDCSTLSNTASFGVIIFI